MSGHIEIIIKAPSLTFLSLVQEEDIGSINVPFTDMEGRDNHADMDEQQVS
jgi:hypothetical protein